MWLKPMIDPKKNIDAVAGKGAETPVLLVSSCYNTGWCYECSQWQGRHCPAAISGIGQPLATSGYPLDTIQYPYHYTLGIHITIHNSGASPDN